mmetsp:Transcript_29786/g.50039  ORF Transcript_29786/g.50039 Transcript_29786/m.50039 type:complete len:425 (-) Transcript_29786:423-1697(-)|eukprot:CAMPEP_0198214842 /NCGR_PEP_ID=MMETSP1445-20131203/44584_1 /TAXON_ID=36898 /ORGANISM="Pyramimonas sp., Strain CCMP2087" /LENGTH=424 /DNA_ID=CAMNT_0043890209 /DNA_START=1 /DNA_END=1275 /DNA_ORIENTATION=+
MHRVNVLSQHFSPSDASAQSRVEVQSTAAKHFPISDDDVVICSAVRTPLCKANKGMFKNTPPDVMLSAVMKAAVERSKVDPTLIGDIVIGNVLLKQGAVYFRQAQGTAGIPFSVPLHSVNRQCSSGLQAIATVANAIKAGEYECGLAGGVESMSLGNMANAVDPSLISEAVFENQDAKKCLIPMGITSENVAAKWGISRQVQDQMAADSHAKAVRAQNMGYYDEEIVPVTTTVKNKDGEASVVTVRVDEGMRPGLTAEALGKLKAVFKKTGSTTAGNASQMTDGAACVLLASRSFATKHRLPVLAVFRSYAVVGCPPEIMGIGPAIAIPAALKKVGLSVSDIDIFEVNEAFASQATYCVHELGIPAAKLNPKGGAIALGHPLGATGARQMATLLPELKRTGGKLGVISMCIGTGMGAAAVIELV